MRCAQRLTIWICGILLAPCALSAQTMAAPGNSIVIPRGTAVRLQFDQTISSQSAHQGEPLRFTVEHDVTVDGRTVIQAGSVAEGTVEQVRSRRSFGVAGRLMIDLASVRLTNGQAIALVGHKVYRGRTHYVRMGLEMTAAAVVYIPSMPVFLLSRGSDTTILKGTYITAFTQQPVEVRSTGLPAVHDASWQVNNMLSLLPNRVLNGDGREGDMLNLVFLARESDLQRLFQGAGWLKADRPTMNIIWHLIWNRTHYKRLPMSRLYMFGRPQDLAYVLPDPNAIVSRRHHVRLWKTDRTVNGVPLWVGAATHDIAIEVEDFHIFHRIDPNVDEERDFIVANLAQTSELSMENYILPPEAVRKAETATGQAYYSDGRMAYLQVDQTPPAAHAPLPGATTAAATLPAATLAR